MKTLKQLYQEVENLTDKLYDLRRKFDDGDFDHEDACNIKFPMLDGAIACLEQFVVK